MNPNRKNNLAGMLGVLLAALIAGPSARAADMYWNAQGGGTFQTGANWAGGVVPGPADRAWFDLGMPGYIVDFTGSVTNVTLFVPTDVVTLDLGLATK